MHLLPERSAVPGRCASCGEEVSACTCAFDFELFGAMARSAGVTAPASQMALFFGMPTSMQIAAWVAIGEEELR